MLKSTLLLDYLDWLMHSFNNVSFLEQNKLKFLYYEKLFPVLRSKQWRYVGAWGFLEHRNSQSPLMEIYSDCSIHSHLLLLNQLHMKCRSLTSLKLSSEHEQQPLPSSCLPYYSIRSIKCYTHISFKMTVFQTISQPAV